MRRMRSAISVIVGVLGVASCARTQPTASRREVGDLLEAGGGPADAIAAEQDEESRAQIRDRVADLMQEPLTLDRALQVAVLNNRSLRATLEELGVAQADLVQAGLLANPVVAGDLVNSTTGNGLGGGLSLSQSLLSAFLIPARRRLAKAQLRFAVVTVADATLALVRDVKVAYAEAQAALALRDLHKTLVQTAEVASELADRQHAAGNIPDLDRELFAAELDAARLELAERDLDVKETREQLNRLLGLWGPQVDWTLGSALPSETVVDESLEQLEATGIRQRLDVSAARANVEAIEYAIKLRRRGIVPQVDAGPVARNEVGNDAGHEWVIGAELSIEIPIFDPGHADFARLRAHLRQAQHALEQTAIEARSEIRTHREELVTASARANYLRQTVLPRRQRVGQRAIERYNGMLLSAYELLELRAQQVDAHIGYIEARREYWTARAELERAVGGRLPHGADEP